jgi:O-antigen ligase
MPANLALLGIAFLGLVLAVFIGSLIGNNEPRQLLLLVGVAFGILFVVRLYRYVWQLSLLLTFVSFVYRPTSFAFGPLELSCALGFGLAAIFFWQKRRVDLPDVLMIRSFSTMQVALLIWLVYIALHMIYNFRDPVRPGEFSTNNAIKSYFALAAPFVVLLYCARNPSGLSIKRDFYWTISWLCLLGLIVNLGARAYELVAYRSVFIPGVNASSNPYALRTLAPVAMLLGSIALTGATARRLSVFRRLSYWMLVGLGLVGATFSGGRVTILFGFAAVCGVLVFRRKVGLLTVAFGVGLLGLVAAQFMSDWINSRANPYVQRSLQLVLVEQRGESLESIESSTNWRWELASRAIAEWQSSPRIFWFGRSTYGFGAQDERAKIMFGGYEALIRTALRRGATHNLVTDLLVAYGLIGGVLYMIAYGSIVRFLWVVRKRPGLSDSGKDLALACMLLSLLTLVLELVGAGGMRVELIWLTIILIAALYFGPGVAPAAAPRVTAKVPPPVEVGARRFVRTPRRGDGRLKTI